MTAVLLVLVAGLVTLGTVQVAARDADALAVRTSTQVARGVVDSLAALRFDASDERGAADVLAPFLRSGSVHRVKVWRVEGATVRVVHSDEPRVVGDVRPFDAGMAARLDAGDAVVLPVPADVEHRYEQEHRLGLREVFVGFTSAQGAPMRLEVYVPVDDRRLVRDTATHVLPVVLGGLLVLAAASVPVTLRAARRSSAAAAERARLLRYGLAASDSERRRVAQLLHDGPVQDLAAARLLIEQAVRLPDGAAGTALVPAHRLVADSVHDLRTLLVDLHPSGEPGHDLAAALASVVDRVRDELGAGPRVSLVVHVAHDDVTPTAAGFVLRAARELLRNVWRHARADRVTVTVGRVGPDVVLEVVDDGVGVGPGPLGGGGHVGLRLLDAAAQEVGGRAVVVPADAGGTQASVTVPAGLTGSAVAPVGVRRSAARVRRWRGAPPAARR